MIYFITARDLNMVKIGYSVDPHARLVKVRADSPVPVLLEWECDGDRDAERALHLQFAQARVRGEWFHITADIEAHMKTCYRVRQPRTLKPTRFTWEHEIEAVNGFALPFYQEVAAFGKARGISARELGAGALNDTRFVAGLLKGRRVHPETQQRVREWMAAQDRKAA